MRTIPAAAALVLCAAALPASTARADEWHPYLFSTDGLTLPGRRIAVESGAGWNGVVASGGSLSPDDARRISGWVGGAVGIVDRVEIDGTFLFGEDPGRGFRLGQVKLEARALALRPTARVPLAISVGAGYIADSLLESGVTGLVAMSALLGRVDLTLNLRAAHYFHEGRDPVDVFVSAGVLVRATGWLRVGAEYVGEELEALVSGDVEDTGWGRHYLGPTAALSFLDHRLRVSATGGAVATQAQWGPMARTSLAYVF